VKWQRAAFAIACASRTPSGKLGVLSRTVCGYVLAVDDCPCWGVHQSGSDWTLTHAPTGYAVPGRFAKAGDAKRFAEEMVAEVDCAIGTFGRSLRGVKGCRAFYRAGLAKRKAFGFEDLVGPVRGVEYGPRERAVSRG
jgi:hypothetical protein